MPGHRCYLLSIDLFANDKFIFIASFRSVEHTQINARRILLLVLILTIADQVAVSEVAVTARRRIISTVLMMMVSHDDRTENNDPLTSCRSTTLHYYL